MIIPHIAVNLHDTAVLLAEICTQTGECVESSSSTETVLCTYDSEMVATQPYLCLPSSSQRCSESISCLVVKVCSRSTKTKRNFVLKKVPLALLGSIKQLKAYLRSHLNLGVITAAGYFYKGRKIWLQTNEELTQLVGKELSRGKGTLWCEAASQDSGHRVDCSGEEDLSDD